MWLIVFNVNLRYQSYLRYFKYNTLYLLKYLYLFVLNTIFRKHPKAFQTSISGFSACYNGIQTLPDISGDAWLIHGYAYHELSFSGVTSSPQSYSCGLHRLHIACGCAGLFCAEIPCECCGRTCCCR